MGVTKQYLRFVHHSTFGLISSAKGGATTIPGSKNNLVASACGENVIIWNLKSGEKVVTCPGEKHEVTSLACSVQGNNLAVGYNNGSIKIFEVKSGEATVTLNGHKSAVTSLRFEKTGHRLVSGSKDTNVIIWDVVNESGLFRLQGHKGPITRVVFMDNRNIVVSSSKDSFVKFWDLNVQHCFKTLTGHVSEVWDFALIKNDSYLVTGSNDAELRIWKLIFKSDEVGVAKDPSVELEPGFKKVKVDDEAEDKMSDEEEDVEDEFDAGLLKIERLGSVLREGQDRVSHIVTNEGHQELLACHGSDNTVELFSICSEEEIKKRLMKKAKKERRKRKDDGQTAEDVTLPEPTIQEEFRRLKGIKAAGKVRQLHVDVKDRKGIITLSTGNNIIEQFHLTLDEKSADPSSIRKFDRLGHRSDVRTVSFSSDNTAIASVSHEALSVWNRASQSCIRTIPSGYGLCSTFVPGDRHVVVGTKKGSLQIFDLVSSTMTEEIDAHNGEVWSMHLYPDRKGLVTASGDKTVKFWQFELVNRTTENKEGPATTEKQLSVIHLRTLKLDDSAVAVRLSNDGRLVAVSLLDSTIKVFFRDTLKFFLSLYGHKLPALALDVSTDSTLLVSGSADKNVKIWGLDFGDCHKSIFAHDDNISALQFLPNTHMFFTVSKDGSIKQWDADNFERILTLEGHHGEIWDLCVSPNGKYVVTCGHDKTLRLWEKTQEPLVLSDERETEREEEDDKQAAGDSRVVPGEHGKEAGLPSKKTAETERSAERLMEAIQVYKNYQVDLEDVRAESKASGKAIPNPPLPPLMTLYPNVETPEDHMAETIARIKSSELEETLLVLPLDNVLSLMEILETLLEKKLKAEVVSRIFFFLVEIHFGPLTASGSSKQLLTRVKGLVDARLSELQDTIGFNLAALNFVQSQQEEREKMDAFIDATSKFRDKKKKRKQKQKALKTALISV